MNSLRCQSCDYDLRGQYIAKDAFRCPECGTVSTLWQIASKRAIRRRERRRFDADATIMLCVALGFAILKTLYDVPSAAALRVRFEFVLNTVGAAIALAIIGTVFGLTTMAWPGLPSRDRATCAIGAPLFLLMYPGAWGVAIFLAWMIGFHIAAVRQAAGVYRA